MLFVAALSLVDPAKVLPLYLLLAVLNSSRSSYASTTGRPIPPSVVKATTAVTCTLYALPIILLSSSPLRKSLPDHMLVPWSFLPLLILILIQLLAANLAFINRPPTQPARPALEKEYMKVYFNKDYPPLTVLYKIILVSSLLAGVVIPTSPNNQRLICINIVVHCLHSTFDMRGLGYATTFEALRAALVILLGAKIVGPSTIYVGTWYWRENVIYRLCK